MASPLLADTLNELLRDGVGDSLHHRESQTLEFKEQFHTNELGEYIRDFAAFANNRGGYIIFGVKDKPRQRIGMSPKSMRQFEDLDSRIVTEKLQETFSCEIRCDIVVHRIGIQSFGVFYVHECRHKPAIAKKNMGEKVKNGDILYRYGGKTQKIQHAELESIIVARVEQNDQQWFDLMKNIKNAGPSNAAILDTKGGAIHGASDQIIIVDENLIPQLNFIREGEFNEAAGATTLKLVGSLQSVSKIEVVKREKEDILRDYPLSFREMVAAVKNKCTVRGNIILDILRENHMRGDRKYSTYVFRSKKDFDDYTKTGEVKQNTPCIYNNQCVDYIVSAITTTESLSTPFASAESPAARSA